jgi:Uma2 family endonuclease
MTRMSSNPVVPKEWPEPAWEVALLFPLEGHWTEEEYLSLQTNRLVECSDDSIKVLGTPRAIHQLILLFIYNEIKIYTQGLGTHFTAGDPVRLRSGEFGEPDIVYFLAEHTAQNHDKFGGPADLVMEVVSEDRHNDLVTKRREYAEIGIPEYWIVDPEEDRITVLRLAGDHYEVHGVFVEGTFATSVVLPDFSIDVSAVFARKVPE